MQTDLSPKRKRAFLWQRVRVLLKTRACFSKRCVLLMTGAMPTRTAAQGDIDCAEASIAAVRVGMGRGHAIINRGHAPSNVAGPALVRFASLLGSIGVSPV